MRKKYGNEFKIGIFVIICLLGLGYITLRTGNFNIKKEGYNIFVVFPEVAGLEANAPVMLNGLEVGRVENMEASYDNDETCVLLKLWIDGKAKIRENPEVSIKTLGLMGEKFIQISARKGEGFVKPEDRLYAKGPTDLDQLVERAEVISQNTNELLLEVRKLTENLNSTLEDNRGSVDNIIKNLEATSVNLEEFSGDIKKHPWKLLIKTKEKK